MHKDELDDREVMIPYLKQDFLVEMLPVDWVKEAKDAADRCWVSFNG